MTTQIYTPPFTGFALAFARFFTLFARGVFVSMKRDPISKKLRFETFARDNFTCRYCGLQSDQVRLVIDHVHPVCEGGTNDPENLVTSCEACNAGKGGKPIHKVTTNETHRLALAQDMQEQIQALRAAKKASKARSELRQEVCNYICQARGIDGVNKSELNVFCSFVQRYGASTVFRWVDIAASKLHPKKSGSDFLRYVCGIRKRDTEVNHA
jgi:hypothetical protein